MGLSGCYGVIKYLVVLVNFLFWLIGVGILILAIWMLLDSTFYFSMTQDENNYYIGLYIFLAVGTLMLIVAFLGCCGAFRESRCMLVSFFSCLLIILVAEIAAGTWAYYNADQLENLIKDTVKSTIQDEYTKVESRTITFDAIQRELHCCGSNGPSDWAGSQYNKIDKSGMVLAVSSILPTYRIPPSCCKKNISASECEFAQNIGAGNIITNSIYQQGCVDKLIEAIRQRASLVVTIGFGLALLEFLGLIFSCILCYAIKRTDRYKA